jgi:hypothetical protein
MKFFTAPSVLALTAFSAEAFAPVVNTRRSFAPTTLRMTASTSTESLIKEAMEISKKYGPSSPEARIAWEAVDEVSHAADMKEATKPGLDEECVLDESLANNMCMEYSEKLYALEKLIHGKAKAKVPEPKKLNVDDIPRVPLADKSSRQYKLSSVATSPDITAAIENAKIITEENGIASSEARIAWEVVEELSASVSHAHDDEMFRMEQSNALKELNRILKQQ